MSYRAPYGDDWPDFFTENDINALRESWLGGAGSGGTTTVTTGDPTGIDWPPPLDPTAPWTPLAPKPKQLEADPEGDVLIGGFGDDLLRGGPGADELIGMAGADRLFGGLGANRFDSIADGKADWIAIQPDGVLSRQARRKPWPGESVDIISEMGAEDLVGIQGVETSALVFRKVKLVDSPYGDLRGLGIFANGRLEAVYTGMALSIWQLRARTVGLETQPIVDLPPLVV